MVTELHFTGDEDILDLLEEAKSAMFDLVPSGTFVDARPLYEEILEAWLAARTDKTLAPIEKYLEDAEAGANSWGTCSHEWLSIRSLRSALAAARDMAKR